MRGATNRRLRIGNASLVDAVVLDDCELIRRWRIRFIGFAKAETFYTKLLLVRPLGAASRTKMGSSTTRLEHYCCNMRLVVSLPLILAKRSMPPSSVGLKFVAYDSSEQSDLAVLPCRQSSLSRRPQNMLSEHLLARICPLSFCQSRQPTLNRSTKFILVLGGGFNGL
jgi:hypothetical protein